MVSILAPTTIPIPRLAPEKEKEKEIADAVRQAEQKRDEANKIFGEKRGQIENLMFVNLEESN